MPTHVLQFEAMWSSDKLARCEAWVQAEYAWLYGLADVNGSFELTNLRVLWGKVAAIRKDLSIERLEQIFDELQDKGLLFVWQEDGKRYGHWTGSEKPGRLLSPSLRKRYRPFAPSVPKSELKSYLKSVQARLDGNHRNLNEASMTGVGLRCRVQGVGVSKNICANPSGSHDSLFPSKPPKDTSDVESPSEPPPLSSKQSAEAETIKKIFAYYLAKTGKNPKLYEFTPLRKQKGLARLGDCLKKTGGDLPKAEALMTIAIDNLTASAWHMGENPQKKKYDSWERNLFKSTEQLEDWLNQVSEVGA